MFDLPPRWQELGGEIGQQIGVLQASICGERVLELGLESRLGNVLPHEFEDCLVEMPPGCWAVVLGQERLSWVGGYLVVFW